MDKSREGCCKYRPCFYTRPSSPVNILPRVVSRCGKCFKNKQAPQEFTSGWCNDCRKKLVESLATTETELQETTTALTKRAELAEGKVVYLKKFHMSPLNPAFKGDINFYVVGSKHLLCKLCEHRLEGFDPPIQAHRFILSGRSPIFYQILETRDWSDEWEKDTGHIEIHGVTPPLLRSVLNYMYIGEIAYSEEVIPADVLKFAHTFQIEELKADVGHEIANNLTNENLKEALALATEFNAEVLKFRCKNFFQERFS